MGEMGVATCGEKGVLGIVPAAGTRTRNWLKWSLARRKPKAEDFIEVSMATVRHVCSSKKRLRPKYEARPPKMCRAAHAAWSEAPAARMGAEHSATAAPTRRHVESTPTIGEKGSIFLTALGNL